MNMHLGSEAAFRAEIAEFCHDNLDPEVRRRSDLGLPLDEAATLDWQRKLLARGWGAPSWDEEWGGTDWDMRKHFIFEEEMAAQGAPLIGTFAIRMIGPILQAYGNAAQKAHFLPRTLNFDYLWCQGYSEPGAGSDLASLQTRAVRNGEDYIVNGTKIWTSAGHLANHIFCLVRTSTEGRQQGGISFLLIDLDTPGVSSRPVHHFYGPHVFNQFFFDDVRVPVANRIGAENAGWGIAKSLLEHERLFSSRHTEARRKLGRLRRLSHDVRIDGRPAREDPHFRNEMAKRAIELRALENATMRALERLVDDGGIGPFASVLKLRGIEVNQRLDRAIVQLLGPDALPAEATWEDTGLAALFPDEARNAAESRYWWRGPAIAGGSQEVQRTIISKHILNL